MFFLYNNIFFNIIYFCFKFSIMFSREILEVFNMVVEILLMELSVYINIVKEVVLVLFVDIMIIFLKI